MFNNYKFISFEGIDGSGKTTQSKMLAEYLKDKKKNIVYTREPGGTEFGEVIRNLVTNYTSNNISELFLIMAARKEHLEKVIKPALYSKKIVICDRYIDSTFAYQVDSELMLDHIYSLHKDYMEDIMPDITFYIDISYKVANERMASRKNLDRFDKLSPDMFNILKENYNILVNKFPDRIVKIDGHREIESVAGDILRKLGFKR